MFPMRFGNEIAHVKKLNNRKYDFSNFKVSYPNTGTHQEVFKGEVQFFENQPALKYS